MLTFRVLPQINITHQTHDMIFHPVTLYWHWVDQFWFLATFLMLSAKRKSSWYHFESRPGIDTAAPPPPPPPPPVTKRTLSQLSHCVGWFPAYQSPSEKGSSLKGKNLLPWGANSFRVDPMGTNSFLLEWTPFSEERQKCIHFGLVTRFT